ncbi:MAG: 1-phosphofructokinase family hexose kinase [Coriobacteriia bacterium]|jgi:1-phosphofructokinase|nr:PfkB family carbohydrate kinase [Anaerosomatales bacterium]
MILTVTLNPSVDKVFEVPSFGLGRFNQVESIETQPGGKGVNVGLMLRALGHEVVAMGFAGDGPGRFVQNALRDAGITTAFTVVNGKTRTNYAIIDPDAGTLTQVHQTGPEISPDDLAAFRTTYERLLGTAEHVVIAGSLPPGVEPTFCAELVRLATARDVRVTLNAREPIMAASLPARPFLAEPDLRNRESYDGFDLTDHDERLALARTLAESAGSAVVNAEHEVLLVSADEAYAISVPTCGLRGRIRLDDALIAGMVDAMIAGGALAEIGREGVAGALAAAGSPTGQFTSRADVEGCLARVEVVPVA